ncbi:hypothetical protein AAES_94111 [Amazona aestiva]|uniref:Uncharacterized protein n=1 Tax=Amazona aestiva TaxID=12930 RepID=A0A0Q3MCK5_AMAAE|nr:hypothetical protein AAES_94111 [Amazona aestiva]
MQAPLDKPDLRQPWSSTTALRSPDLQVQINLIQFIFPFIHSVVLVSFAIGMLHECRTLKEQYHLITPAKSWKTDAALSTNAEAMAVPTQQSGAQVHGLMVSMLAPELVGLILSQLSTKLKQTGPFESQADQA